MKKLFAFCMMAVCTVVCAIGFAGCGCNHPNIDGGEIVSRTVTCTQSGTETVKCPACGETQVRNAEAYGHRYMAIDKDGNSFSGKGENFHCNYCHEPLIVLTTKQTLPATVTTTFNGNNNTVYTAKVIIKSVKLNVYSDDTVSVVFTCEKGEGSSENAYLGFSLKTTDKNDTARVSNAKVRFSNGNNNRAQERAIKVGEEFELHANYSLSVNQTEFASFGLGSYIKDKKQAQLQLEFSDLTISAAEA